MKYTVGDNIIVRFLGTKYNAVIKEIKELSETRSVYTVITLDKDKTYIPYVGEDGSEKYANIHTEDNLTKTKTNGKSKRKSKKSDEESC